MPILVLLIILWLVFSIAPVWRSPPLTLSKPAAPKLPPKRLPTASHDVFEPIGADKGFFEPAETTDSPAQGATCIVCGLPLATEDHGEC